ncbi:MAG: leucine-rich repeat protein [Bacteroidales bacterium]|nr:leucine-rich repeat protein [Bacteroidales bacterium]
MNRNISAHIIFHINKQFVQNDEDFYCIELENIVLPEGLSSLGYRAFYNCVKLKSIVIPSSVARIESGVFLSMSTTFIHNDTFYCFRDRRRGVL